MVRILDAMPNYECCWIYHSYFRRDTILSIFTSTFFESWADFLASKDKWNAYANKIVLFGIFFTLRIWLLICYHGVTDEHINFVACDIVFFNDVNRSVNTM